MGTKITSLEEENNTLKKEVHEFKNKEEEMLKNHRLQEGENEKLKNEIEEYKNLNTKDNDDETKNKITSLEEENNKLKKEVEEFKNKEEEMLKNHKLQEDENEKLKNEIEEYKNLNTNDIDDKMKNIITSLEEENNKLKKEA